jgi:hypothetical protein
LVRAVGATGVLQVIDAAGDTPTWNAFQAQQTQAAKPLEEQLRAFIAAKGRKIEYAPLLVDAVDPTLAPRPLREVLEVVRA